MISTTACGWTPLIGNYEDSLDSILPPYRDLRAPMLSNLTVWDTGTDGAPMGTYALKLATRPRAGALAVGSSGSPSASWGPIRLEAYFTFKPEASELRLSETDVRAVGVLFDLQDVDKPGRAAERSCRTSAISTRWMASRSAVAIQKGARSMRDIGGTGKTKSHFHLAPEGWEDIPGGDQLLCYNEIATKQNWHYLRLDFDLATMSYLRLPMQRPRLERCRHAAHADARDGEPVVHVEHGLLVETDTDKRAFLYLDSVLLSTEA